MKITLNNLNDVYKSKVVDQKTLELKGYRLVKDFFVDSSGFGAPDEPAFTKNKFHEELTNFIKENGACHSFITGVGQFQVYVSLFKKDGEKRAKNVTCNTLRIETEDGYIIRLHQTDIITVTKDKIIFNTGGWETRTTARRMNEFLPLSGMIYQRNWEFHFEDSQGKVYKFEDGRLEIKNGKSD